MKANCFCQNPIYQIMDKKKPVREAISQLLTYDGEWRVIHHVITDDRPFLDDAVIIQCIVGPSVQHKSKLTCIILKENLQ